MADVDLLDGDIRKPGKEDLLLRGSHGYNY